MAPIATRRNAMTMIGSRRPENSSLAQAIGAAVLLAVAMFAAPASAKPLLTAPASAPDALCSGELSASEIVVCSDAELKDLMKAMFAARERALASVQPAQADGIRDAMNEWGEYVKKCGTDKDCIRSAILDQLQAINAIAQIAAGKSQ
jgi:uncharacterized protein